MKRTYFLKALLGSAVIAFASTGQAQDPAAAPSASPSTSDAASENASGTQGGSGGSYVQKLIQMLGLSDAQVAQIKTILETSEGQSKTILADTSLAEDQKSVQLSAVKTSTTQQITALLTPGQQQKFTALLQQFLQHHSHRK